jgi:hypothetical protein
MEATETAWWASNQVWKERGGRRPYPADLMGTPDQPECLRAFARWEIEEASEFLVRLGMIRRPGDKRV